MHASDDERMKELLDQGLSLARAEEMQGSQSGILSLRLLDKLGDSAVEALDYGQALEYYERALAFNEAYSRHALKPPSYSRIGIVYYNLGDGDRAIEYYETGLEILEKYDPSDMSIKGTLLANIGEAHVKEGRTEEAIHFLELGKEVYAKSGQQRSLAFLDRRHAEALYTLGHPKEALSMAEKSARGFLESELDIEAGATLSWLAARYLEMDDFEKAENTLKRAQQLVDPDNRGAPYLLTLETSAFWRMDYARGMAQILARLGKADEAWQYSEMALKLSEQRFESDKLESLANADVLIKLRDRDRDVEFMRQEALVSSLQLDQSRSRMILSALAAVVALLLSLLLFWFYRTQRKLAHTKGVFLSEIHHRTKNNLQVLSSLLSLDARRSRDTGRGKVATQDAANRARTMALVHDHIYHHSLGEDRQTDLNAFLKDLLRLLEESLGREEVLLTGEFNALPVDVDRVTPLGLIVAELVTNAFKYAFDEQGGRLALGECLRWQ
ncbi:tetratricopeptide repeat protein [Erythrobacter sp. W53]|uniref:tetratricopeptide repeat protein n=1 Tax=Erythrobacter sp. W53 TaxID=3425947 RepID=UPI003D76672A